MSIRWRVFPGSGSLALAASPPVAQPPRVPRLNTAEIEPLILSRLRNHVPAPAGRRPATPPPQASPSVSRQSFLRGALSTLPAQELLEYLALLRRPGVLEVKAPDGSEAHCAVTEDHLISARLGHLKDNEAILELLGWKEGTFELRPQGAPKGEASSTRLAELAMEHARLDDELQRRAERVPVPNEPLVLRLGKPLPKDTLECGLDQLVASLEREPGLSLAELETRVPLCRLKVRLAAALLHAAGCL